MILWRDSQSTGSRNQVVSRLFRALLPSPLTLSFLCSAYDKRCLETSKENLHVDIEAYQVMIHISSFVEQEMLVGFAPPLDHTIIVFYVFKEVSRYEHFKALDNFFTCKS